MRIESNDANVGVGTTSDMKVELDTDTLKKVMKDYKRIK